MFQIDRSANRLRKLERTSFSEVGFREREHLQEWLATMPDALCEAMSEGEDGLLIIQKEFDGFDATRERLDLLALDRAGQLVIIENKLDDSGRDVVWQALKYAAYCSSLKKAEIVGIFQQYLDRLGGGDAAGMICEFLGEDTLDEVVLNDGTNQRIVFIAANFRREVTATVLWLGRIPRRSMAESVHVITPRPVASRRPCEPPMRSGLPVTTAVSVRRTCIEYVSSSHAMICSFVFMSGAGISLSGPNTSMRFAV